jgi:signal transduction histidine kinase
MPPAVDHAARTAAPSFGLGLRPSGPSTPSAEQALPTVLVIDDNPAFQRLLGAVLEREYQTLSAEDGWKGYELAAKHGPDLIILDVGLPGMDGQDVLHALRSNPRLASVPVLVVTGRTDEELNLRLLEEGAQDLLHKPFSLSELQVRVRNLIATKRTMDMLNVTIGQHETDLLTLAGRVAQQQQDLQQALEHLSQARHVAEQANRMKSNFLRMMSHELKTPVTAMQLHMRLIESGADGCTCDELQDGIVRMRRSSRRLLHLVDTFLEWSRVDQDRSQLTLVDASLVDLARDVALELDGYASQKGLSIEVQLPEQALPAVRTDRTIARLLLVHLLYRAVQSSRSGKIVIRLAAIETGQTITIRDTAAPLSSSQQAEAFDSLRDPSDLGTRAGTGSGLDLQIVRDIARAVRGALSLDVDAVHGNAWVLSLPTAHSPAEGPERPPLPAPAAR